MYRCGIRIAAQYCCIEHRQYMTTSVRQTTVQVPNGSGMADSIKLIRRTVLPSSHERQRRKSSGTAVAVTSSRHFRQPVGRSLTSAERPRQIRVEREAYSPASSVGAGVAHMYCTHSRAVPLSAHRRTGRTRPSGLCRSATHTSRTCTTTG